MNNEIMTLLKSELSFTTFTGIFKHRINEEKIEILALVKEYNVNESYKRIGWYNVEMGYGEILVNGEYKEYKNLKSLYNAIYKIKIVDYDWTSMDSYEYILRSVTNIKNNLKEAECITNTDNNTNDDIKVKEETIEATNTTLVTKKYKMYDNTIRNFTTASELKKLQSKNWELIHESLAQKEKQTKQTINKIENYVSKLQQTKQYKNDSIGLVYTKLDEDINNKNLFYIWIDKGYIVEHEAINLNQVV